MRSRSIRILGIAVFIVSGLYACTDKSSKPHVNMTPGLWEITSSMESSKLPIVLPPSTSRQCLTEVDFVPRTNIDSSKCEISDLQTGSELVSYTMKCSAGGTTSVSHASISYLGTSMEGTISTEMTGGPAAMTMTLKLKGERIGACN